MELKVSNDSEVRSLENGWFTRTYKTRSFAYREKEITIKDKSEME